MNGVLRLIQNEMIKITRQLSWRIMAVIILLIAAGLPILSHLLRSSTYTVDYVELASKSPQGSIRREFYEAAIEADKYFEDKGFDSDNWQYSDFYHRYQSCCTDIRGLELIANEGKDIEEVMNEFHISVVSWYFTYTEDKEETQFLYTPVAFDPEVGYFVNTSDEEERDFTKEDAKNVLPEVQKWKEYLEKGINTPFSEYLKANFGNIVDTEQFKKDYDSAKAKYEKDPAALRQYDVARLRYECGIKLSGAIEKLLEISEDMKPIDEKNQTRILQTLCDYVEYLPEQYGAESEERFKEQNNHIYYFGIDFFDYDEYLEAVKLKQTEYEQAQDILVYAVRHNIAIPHLSAGSVRNDLMNALNINISVLMFFAIFMAAVTVSSEHSSGAVRLLLIRPRSRWKILLSKLVCLFILLLGMTVLTSVISFAETAALNGWGDLSVPYLMRSGSGVVEIAPILYYIFQNGVSILPSVLIMFFALFMSVVTKRSVFALAISLLANVFGGAVSNFLYNIVRKSAQWLKLTPIPYFDLGSTFPDPVKSVDMYYSPQIYGITLEQGALMMCIYSAIIIAVTFVIFKKQQIK